MTSHVHEFDACEGGLFRVSLTLRRSDWDRHPALAPRRRRTPIRATAAS
jgi:hypothetical protein